MNKLRQTSTSVAKGAAGVQSPVTVCMHVRSTARLDPRVMREATTLVEAGFAVCIVDIEEACTRPIEEDIDGVHLKHIHRPNWLDTVRHYKPARIIKSVHKLIGCTFRLLQTPADIYHAHDVNALPACYLTAQLRGKLLIFDAHEMPLYDLEDTRHRWLRALLTLLVASMLRRSVGVITVSPPIVEELHKRYSASEVALVRNIPRYRVCSKSTRVRQYLGLSSNIRIVLYQGSIIPDRNLDKLVHAAAFLERDIVVVLMGEGFGSLALPSELNTLIASEGVADRIKIIPAVPYEELLDWTASADMGVIVSSPDYSLNNRMLLPNKLFEYLMAGLPVLSSPIHAIAEVIETHGVGRVLSSLEPAHIGEQINTMLADHAEYTRMQRNALEVSQREFCWEKERQQLIGLYQRVLKQNEQGSHQKAFPNLGAEDSREGEHDAHSLYS